MNTTSVSLIERVCKSSDAQDWERFVELYTPLLYYWAKRTGCESSEAADLVQEVFALLLEKLPRFNYNADQSFRAWLRTVAHNCWRNCRRRQTLPRDAGADLAEIPAPESDDQFWESEYRQQLTQSALSLIKSDFAPQTWQAFWETTVHGKTPAETAAALGISTASVYAARSRVLSRLRQEFSGFLE